MKKLDRLILFTFLKSYFFVVALLISIICVIDFAEKNEKFIKNNLDPGLIGQYYLSFFPYIASFLTPITIFIATVFVTAKMAARTEIVAILSSGVSFPRFFRPYLIGSILIAILSFYLSSWVIPESNKFRLDFEIKYINKPFYVKDRDIHIKTAPEIYLYMESYNNINHSGYKFTIERIKDNKLLTKLSAENLKWNEETSKWTLKDWQVREINGIDEMVYSGEELDTALNISPQDFESKHRYQESLTLTELYNYIDELKSRGADDIQIYEVEKQTKYASPFAIIILTFIGVVVSARKVRGGAGFQIALGFLIAFIFILFYVLFKGAAERGSMEPWISIQIPNLIFTGVGLAIYRILPR